MLSEEGGLFGNCLCFNDSWSITFSGQVEFCQWYRGSICMTAISGVKKVEVLGGVSMFLIFSLQIFQPEYTLLFKPSIVGNFERKGGNTCLQSVLRYRAFISNQIIFLFQPQMVGGSELYFIMSVACVEVSDNLGELACF